MTLIFLFQQHSAGDIMIRNIQLRHAGKYTCAVQTKVDSSSIATDLIVRGENALKPTQPIHIVHITSYIYRHCDYWILIVDHKNELDTVLQTVKQALEAL